MKDSIVTKSSREYDSLYHIPSPGSDDGEMPPTYTLGPDFEVPEEAISQLEEDGVVCIRNLLDTNTVDALRDEADKAVAEPSSEARFVNPPGDSKIFYYEFNLWRRHPVIRQVTFDSHLADVAASLMRSRHVTLYYTNTFVKDPGAADKVTPWHEDGSYSRFVGDNVINMNISFDAMPAETTLKFKLSSHLREDPMSPAYQKLEHDCMVPKENHVGKFPANFCIKMIGTSSEKRKTFHSDMLRGKKRKW